jgi:hypothetical protein
VAERIEGFAAGIDCIDEVQVVFSSIQETKGFPKGKIAYASAVSLGSKCIYVRRTGTYL